MIYLKWKSYCIAQETLCKAMWQHGWEGSLGENVYISYSSTGPGALHALFHQTLSQLDKVGTVVIPVLQDCDWPKGA